MSSTRTPPRTRFAPPSPAPFRTVGEDAGHSAAPTAWPTESLGAWRLSRILGEGRWTRIYQARPQSLSAAGPADYALKLLRPEHAEHPIALAALRREAHVARQVSHPHLSSVLSEQHGAGEHFLVMPFLEGATLAQLLVRASPARALPEATALWIARQAAEALVALHGRQWLHGDIKPANILVAPLGHATLLDLGFARKLGTAECATTAALQGSPRYLPPEALLPAEVLTSASDVYSLGCVLFETLTGHPPFTCERPDELAAAHLQQEAPALRTILPQLSHELARLVQQMLAKQPLRRPAAEEVVSRLVELEIAALAS